MGFIKLRKNTVFWQYFIMMLLILAIGLLMLALSNYISTDAITDNYLTQVQTNLNHASESLSDDIYAAGSITAAIEYTEYYRMIRVIRGELPRKYVAVLSLLSKAVASQEILIADTEGCIVYFSGCNSIITPTASYPVAEDCFKKSYQFSDMSAQEVLKKLKEGDNYCLLPVQNLTTIEKTVPVISYISRPVNTSMGVMTMYSQDKVMEYFAFNSFPQGSYLYIESDSGEVISQYPEVMPEGAENDCHYLTARMPKLRANVKLWLPKSYFYARAEQVRNKGIIIVLIATHIGIAACYILSKLATKPLRKLVRENSGGEKVNEIHYIADTIAGNRSEISSLQRTLRSNRLSQVFSGTVLTEENQILLEKDLKVIMPPYRIAIIHSKAVLDPQRIAQCLQERQMGELFCESINPKEVCMIFHNGGEQMEILEEVLCEQITTAENEGRKIYCGISGSFDIIENIHVAVRQAYFALSQKEQPGVFTYISAAADSSAWLQHQRLYQAILSNNEENAVRLIHEIAHEPQRGSTGLEIYYNVAFVLRSAWAEMELPLQGAETMVYDQSLLPSENIERLEEVVRTLFLCIRNKREQNNTSRQDKLLVWIGENISDENLCAVMASERFNLSERSIYAMVKESTGRSFNEYVLDLRMRKAGRLLCSTSDSVAEVAQSCGYPAESTFYRVFKKYYNCTPKQYRNGIGKEEG